jgi:hypothetical protein
MGDPACLPAYALRTYLRSDRRCIRSKTFSTLPQRLWRRGMWSESFSSASPRSDGLFDFASAPLGRGMCAESFSPASPGFGSTGMRLKVFSASLSFGSTGMRSKMFSASLSTCRGRARGLSLFHHRFTCAPSLEPRLIKYTSHACEHYYCRKWFSVLDLPSMV